MYLGPWKSKASVAEYDRLVGEWLASGRRLAARAGGASASSSDLRMVELIAAYWRHAKEYYHHPGGNGGEAGGIRLALQHLKKLYAHTAAADFGPLALKAVRESMVGAGWSRRYVNQQVNRLRRMFKWATENELVPATVHHALQAVAPLKAGRTEAPEREPVGPVPPERVEAVRPLLTPQVRAMVDLQAVTGMRPGEVCQMRGVDIDTTGALGVYRPASHKTQHHGHARSVYLGPRAQEILRPWLRPDLSAYLFSPAEAEAWRRAQAHEARLRDGTPLSCGNRPGSNVRRRPGRKPGKRFSVDAYLRSITYACDAAFPPPEHLARGKFPGRGRRKAERWETGKEWKARLGPDRWKELQAWREAHRWHPHQLRHAAATALRKQYGLEAAQVILGHKTLSVTEVYAEKNVAAAMRIMAEVG